MYLVILISPSVTQDAGSGRFLEDRETASDSQRERARESERERERARESEGERERESEES